MKKLLLVLIIPIVIMMMACTCSKSGRKPVKCPSCKTVILDTVNISDDGPVAKGRYDELSFSEVHVLFSGSFIQVNDTVALRRMNRTLFLRHMSKGGQYRYYLTR